MWRGPSQSKAKPEPRDRSQPDRSPIDFQRSGLIAPPILPAARIGRRPERVLSEQVEQVRQKQLLVLFLVVAPKSTSSCAGTGRSPNAPIHRKVDMTSIRENLSSEGRVIIPREGPSADESLWSRSSHRTGN